MTQLTLAQKKLLHELLDEMKLEADRKQAVCDRHADNCDSASYRRLESQANHLYAKKAALEQLMREAGL